MVHQFVDVRTSRFGKGLFASNHIAADTVLCNVTGRELTFEETLQLADKESHSIQIDKDRYVLCDAPFLYTNHSCNPNCALNANLELYALTDIARGEELFWDYSTSMLERHWTMTCLCGAHNCRNIITDFDLLPEELQQAYLKKNVVLPFIVQALQPAMKAHVHRA